VYRLLKSLGHEDRRFLQHVFQKLLMNFTWWVNQKDEQGDNLFSGGFLGLDNIGLFDRSKPLPTGGRLEQSDGTAWMAFYAASMLEIALELASDDPSYEDLASKFFEHFLAIASAMNALGGHGLWDERDGFFYDHLNLDGRKVPLRIRSMVGIIPLFAVCVVDERQLERLKGFMRRSNWIVRHRPDLAEAWGTWVAPSDRSGTSRRLLSLLSPERLRRVLSIVLDEREFLSPFGVRSLSKRHESEPYVFRARGQTLEVHYVPAESDSGMFGGNSNWRGPIWFPVNYLLIESLEHLHEYFGDSMRVECPTGSGRFMNLHEVSLELCARLSKIFLRDERGRRPCHGSDRWATDENLRDLPLFYEYFHGDTGRGCGASHQTGWTALVAECIERVARERRAR
jgi:glycogen debranching enzyme